MRSTLHERYGPSALVTGAGAGLGAAYARQLADHGLDLVLVDRDASVLDALTDELGRRVQVRSLVVDLAGVDAAAQIVESVSDVDVGLLVLNAASSHVGRFVDQDEASIEEQVAVNVRTTTLLVHHLVPRLRARERAGIVVMSSLSSRRGAALVATYAATKAYLAVLAESLWDELRDDEIDVLGVLPGSTRTPGWLETNPQEGLGTAAAMEPDDVVAEALAAIGGDEPTLVVGAENRQAEEFLETLPRGEAVTLVGRAMRETYPRPRRSSDR